MAQLSVRPRLGKAREETVAEILDAAELLFRRVGYAKTTVADIAAELRMSPGNVYRFFASKSAINNAICDRLLAGEEQVAREAIAQPGTAAERLRRLILGLHHSHRSRFTDERRVYDMVEVAMAEHWGAIEAHIATCDAIAAEVIRDGMAAGEFPPGDAEALGAMAMGACCCLLHPTIVAQCAADPEYERDARRLVWFVLQALQNPNRSGMP